MLPREVRRQVKFYDGDSIEIDIGDHGEVILKKYSPMVELIQSRICRSGLMALRKQYGTVQFIPLNPSGCVADRSRIPDKIEEQVNRLVGKDVRSKVVGEGIVLLPIADGDAFYGYILVVAENSQDLTQAEMATEVVISLLRAEEFI